MPPEQQPDFVADAHGNVRDRRAERTGQTQDSSSTEEKQNSSSSYVGWTASGVGFFVLLILVKVFTGSNGARERAQPPPERNVSGPNDQERVLDVLRKWASRPSAIETMIDDLEKTLTEQFRRNQGLVAEKVALLKQHFEKAPDPALPKDQAKRDQSLLQRIYALEKRLESLRITAKLTTGQALALDAASRLGLSTGPDQANCLTAAGIFVLMPEQVLAGGPGR